MNSKSLEGLLILSLVLIFNIAPCYPITTGTASDSLDFKPSQIERSPAYDSDVSRQFDTYELSEEHAPRLSSSFQVMERPTEGEVNVLLMPVYFSDQPFSTSLAEIDDIWDDTLISVENFYRENSFGKLKVNAMVYPWILAPQPISYYGVDNYMVYREIELFEWLLNAVDPAIDFNLYHYIFIVYAGDDQHDDTHIWPHVWTYTYGSLLAGDNVSYDKLGLVGEFSSMGTCAHEFGHSLGLGDYYTWMDDYYFCGYWELMAIGSYNGGGNSPSHLGAYSKIELGWIEESQVIEFTTSGSIGYVSLHALEDSNCPQGEYYAIKIPYYNDSYYLVEFRDNIGFDQGLPDHGVLMCFVDGSRSETRGKLTYYGGDHSTPHLVGVELDDSETSASQSFVRWLKEDFEFIVAAVSEKSESMEVYVDLQTDLGAGYNSYIGLPGGDQLVWGFQGLNRGDVVVMFWDSSGSLWYSGSDFYLQKLVSGSWTTILFKNDIRQDALVYRVEEGGDYRLIVRNDNLIWECDIYWEYFVLPSPKFNIMDSSTVDYSCYHPGQNQTFLIWALISNIMPAWDVNVTIFVLTSENAVLNSEETNLYWWKTPFYRLEKVCYWNFTLLDTDQVNLTFFIVGEYSNYSWTQEYFSKKDETPPILDLFTYYESVSSIRIEWGTYDMQTEVSHCELYRNGELYRTYYERYSSDLITIDLEGIYSFEFFAYDISGNCVSQQFGTVYDVTPPRLIRVLSSVTNVSGLYNLEFEIWDNLPYLMVWIRINEEYDGYPEIDYPYAKLTFNVDDYTAPSNTNLTVEVWMEDFGHNFVFQNITLTLRREEYSSQDELNVEIVVLYCIMIGAPLVLVVAPWLKKKKEF